MDFGCCLVAHQLYDSSFFASISISPSCFEAGVQKARTWAEHQINVNSLLLKSKLSV